MLQAKDVVSVPTEIKWHQGKVSAFRDGGFGFIESVGGERAGLMYLR